MKPTMIAAAAALALSPAAHAATIAITQGWSFGLGSDWDQDQPTFNPALGHLDACRSQSPAT